MMLLWTDGHSENHFFARQLQSGNGQSMWPCGDKVLLLAGMAVGIVTIVMFFPTPCIWTEGNNTAIQNAVVFILLV